MLAAHGGVSHEERKMRPSFAGMVWYLECDDVPALYDSLNKAGYSPEPVDTLEDGAVQFFVRDPDGYEICVC
jgi:predicted enzyme related to lactoylglutathione lyase